MVTSKVQIRTAEAAASDINILSWAAMLKQNARNPTNAQGSGILVLYGFRPFITHKAVVVNLFRHSIILSMVSSGISCYNNLLHYP